MYVCRAGTLWAAPRRSLPPRGCRSSQGPRNSLQALQWGEVQRMSQGHQPQAWRPARAFFSPSEQAALSRSHSPLLPGKTRLGARALWSSSALHRAYSGSHRRATPRPARRQPLQSLALTLCRRLYTHIPSPTSCAGTWGLSPCSLAPGPFPPTLQLNSSLNYFPLAPPISATAQIFF